MRHFILPTPLLAVIWLLLPLPAQSAPCLLVTLTGTMSGPALRNGVAGAGTLVRYGDDSADCGTLKLQFDAGRGTELRLSQLDVEPGQIDAVFLTHMHSDHTEGLVDLLLARWNWNSRGPALDVVCSSDAPSPLGFSLSCGKFVAHIGDAFIQSGEIAQRVSEDRKRLAGGPAELVHLITFEPTDEPQVIWSKAEVRVSAIRSTHIAGHASYRVDTPAGSVVIGGDASNDRAAPPRPTSTSAQVEKLAQGADVIVHSTMHPIMGPERDSGMPPPVFYRQSLAPDLGAMAKRVGAKYLMLTHLAPQVGATHHGPYKVPGGALTEADYRAAAEAGGFTGTAIVGSDLATLRLPAK
ncbi:MBL fold metallo-hydrolase [Bradyrhizobium sp. Pear77]|uniref:MBL fold metallo-hydrolase n=1 Tax=Bradyrhizobium altum TaxID=1571202 RepID=UPI001E324A3E|nr:MBL fold metallo-hydrolase [Bradyrhizobium altum]MCC8958111.1 MBL fold metallo-hydrolase [Bradyrhizobium altum]